MNHRHRHVVAGVHAGRHVQHTQRFLTALGGRRPDGERWPAVAGALRARAGRRMR